MSTGGDFSAAIIAIGMYILALITVTMPTVGSAEPGCSRSLMRKLVWSLLVATPVLCRSGSSSLDADHTSMQSPQSVTSQAPVLYEVPDPWRNGYDGRQEQNPVHGPENEHEHPTTSRVASAHNHRHGSVDNNNRGHASTGPAYTLTYSRRSDTEGPCEVNARLMRGHGPTRDLQASYCRLGCSFAGSPVRNKHYNTKDPIDCDKVETRYRSPVSIDIFGLQAAAEEMRRVSDQSSSESKEKLTALNLLHHGLGYSQGMATETKMNRMKGAWLDMYTDRLHYIFCALALIALLFMPGADRGTARGVTAIIAIVAVVMVNRNERLYTTLGIAYVIFFAAAVGTSNTNSHGQLVAGIIGALLLYLLIPAVDLPVYNYGTILYISLFIVFIFTNIYNSRSAGDYVQFGYALFLLLVLADASLDVVSLAPDGVAVAVLYVFVRISAPTGPFYFFISNLRAAVTSTAVVVVKYYPNADLQVVALLLLMLFLTGFAGLRATLVYMHRRGRASKSFDAYIVDFIAYLFDLLGPFRRIFYFFFGNKRDSRANLFLAIDLAFIGITYLEFKCAMEIFGLRVLLAIFGPLLIRNRAYFLVTGVALQQQMDYAGYTIDDSAARAELEAFIRERRPVSEEQFMLVQKAFPQNESRAWTCSADLVEILRGVVSVIGAAGMGKALVRRVDDGDQVLYTARHVIADGKPFHIEKSAHHATKSNTVQLGYNKDPAIGISLIKGKHTFEPATFDVATMADYDDGFSYLVVLSTDQLVCPVTEFKIDPAAGIATVSANLKRGDSGAPVFGYKSDGSILYIGAVSSGSPNPTSGNTVALVTADVVVPKKQYNPGVRGKRSQVQDVPEMRRIENGNNNNRNNNNNRRRQMDGRKRDNVKTKLIESEDSNNVESQEAINTILTENADNYLSYVAGTNSYAGVEDKQAIRDEYVRLALEDLNQVMDSGPDSVRINRAAMVKAFNDVRRFDN